VSPRADLGEQVSYFVCGFVWRRLLAGTGQGWMHLLASLKSAGLYSPFTR
jgi:hypothetical protein